MSDTTTRERQVFDPDSMREALGRDLPNGLRALADAIEAKDIEGQLCSVKGTALFQHWRDTRMHIHVTLDLAAQAFRWSTPVEGEKVLLDQPPMLDLPTRPKGCDTLSE